jgi:hypothetical protein
MSKQNQRIYISIAFGDAILPVIECEDGFQRVPLKPISDQVGLDWRSQKRKIIDNTYLTARFGLVLGETSLPQMTDLGLKRDQYLIRIDRVTAFLNSLNPERIRSKGNQEAADWLESKHEEWDDALHSYEENGFAAKELGDGSKKYVHLYRLDRIKNAELKRIYAEQVNQDFDLNIPIAKQGSLDV